MEATTSRPIGSVPHVAKKGTHSTKSQERSIFRIVLLSHRRAPRGVDFRIVTGSDKTDGWAMSVPDIPIGAKQTIPKDLGDSAGGCAAVVDHEGRDREKAHECALIARSWALRFCRFRWNATCRVRSNSRRDVFRSYAVRSNSHRDVFRSYGSTI